MFVYQAADYRVATGVLAPAALAPSVPTSDTASQYCMVWPDALTRRLYPEAVQASECAPIRAIEGGIGHVEIFQIDGVATQII